MQAAVDYATVIADSAWQALGRAGIENTPEFRLYFGMHNNPQVAIDNVRGKKTLFPFWNELGWANDFFLD